MAFTITPNQYPRSNPDFFFTLITLLESAGWVRVQDSDGTTYNASGGAVTNADLNATGSLWNPRAWVHLRHPNAVIEFIIQKGIGNPTTGEQWRLYASFAGFSGGSPDATTVPTATDGIQVCGVNDSDRVFGESDRDFRADFIIGDENEGYTFYAQQRPSAFGATENTRGPAVKAGFGFEEVLNPDPADPSPYVVYTMTTGGFASSFDGFEFDEDIYQYDDAIGTHQGVIGRYRDGLEGQQWVKYAFSTIASDGPALESVSADGGSSSPHSAEFRIFPVYYDRPGPANATVTGTERGIPAIQYKGASRLFWQSSRSLPGAFLIKGKRFAIFNSIVIRWDGQSEIQ